MERIIKRSYEEQHNEIREVVTNAIQLEIMLMLAEERLERKKRDSNG